MELSLRVRTITLAAMLALTMIAAPQEQPATKPAKCAPQRSIQPDGSIVVQNADCTTTTIGKDTAPIKKDNEEQKASPDKSESLMPVAPSLDLNDPALKQKYEYAMNGYYSYRLAGYAHRQRVF